MTGHRELITMRRAGYKPAFVFVNDFPCKTDWAKFGDHPTVSVDGDTPELQDFRFLVGVTAIVAGFDPDRVKRITDACMTHAKRVVACVSTQINAFRGEVSSVTDTDEVMTWPK